MAKAARLNATSKRAVYLNQTGRIVPANGFNDSSKRQGRKRRTQKSPIEGQAAKTIASCYFCLTPDGGAKDIYIVLMECQYHCVV